MVDDAEDHMHLAGGVGFSSHVDAPDRVPGDGMRNGMLCIAPQPRYLQQIGTDGVGDVGLRYCHLAGCAVQTVEGVRQRDRSGTRQMRL